MRRSRCLPLLVLALLAGACDNPSEPTTTFSVLGQWATPAADSLSIVMTLSETARQIHGAGSWVSATRVDAFRVSGARFEDEISLHMEFSDRPGVAFQGQFQNSPRDTTLLTGKLYGGLYRGTGIVFVRRDD